MKNNSILKAHLLSVELLNILDDLSGDKEVYQKKLKTRIIQFDEALEKFTENVCEEIGDEVSAQEVQLRITHNFSQVMKKLSIDALLKPIPQDMKVCRVCNGHGETRKSDIDWVECTNCKGKGELIEKIR